MICELKIGENSLFDLLEHSQTLGNSQEVANFVILWRLELHNQVILIEYVRLPSELKFEIKTALLINSYNFSNPPKNGLSKNSRPLTLTVCRF
jgi:hypothetical protein